MKIAVLNGTPLKGVTDAMKKEFLKHLREGNEIIEFYPEDFPPFCVGCKNCFLRGEEKCPHFAKKAPVWEAMLGADVLVFAYPVYALRAPASVKSLLDHLCVHWMVHRPEPAFFEKTAVIITNSVGAPNGAAQRDVKTSLNWMGLSHVYTCGAPMMGDIFIDQMSEKHRQMLERKMKRLAEKVREVRPYHRMSLKVRVLFGVAKLQHKMVLKTEAAPGLDSAHYIRHGWIAGKL